MKTKLFILLFAVIASVPVHADDTELPFPVNIQSPNAANLGKYGDIPMNLFNGVPNINIPLIELKTKDMNLDISMSYDASGIRVNSHPSWVGQNWSLNAGGVITRSVQGYEDEYPSQNNVSGSTYYGTYSNITKAGFFITLGRSPYYKANCTTPLDYSIRDVYDCEPDIFTFNFMGKTGKFFMGNDGNWRVQSDWNIQVIFHTYTLSDGYDYMDKPSFGGSSIYMYTRHKINTINGFKLRDDEGNTYFFGFDDSAVEYSIDFFNQYCTNGGSQAYYPANWRANAWYLKSVYDKNGNQLFTFNYERGKYIAEFYEYKEETKFTVHTSNVSANSSSNVYDEYIKLGGNLVSPVYLTQIYNVPNQQYVVFESSKSNERPYTNFPYYHYSIGGQYSYVSDVGYTFPFNTITDCIYDNQSRKTNGSLLYPYLQNSDTTYRDTEYNSSRTSYPILSLRWRKLDAIHYISPSATTRDVFDHIKTVRFTYNNGVISTTQRLVPTKIDFEFQNQDYKTTAATPECSYSFYYNSIGSVPGYLSRKMDHWGYSSPGKMGSTPNEANETSTKLGVLDSIIYPTGGSTAFEYELNRAYQYVDGTVLCDLGSTAVGGLRIKKITNRTGNESDKVTKGYNYTTIGGILRAKPCYNFSWGTTSFTITKQSIIPLIPLTNFFGSHIEYPEVMETVKKKNTEVSITVYSFTSSNDTRDLSTYGNGDPSHRFTDRSFMRGKLYKKSCEDGAHRDITYYTFRNIEDESFDTSYVTASNLASLKVSAPIETTDDDGNLVTSSYTVATETGSLYQIYYPAYDVVEEEKISYMAGYDTVLSSTKKVYNRSDYARDIYMDYPTDFYNRTSSVKFRLLNSVEEQTSDGYYVKKEYIYPFDDTYTSMSDNDLLLSLTDTYFRIQPICTKRINKNNACIGREEWKYDDFDGLLLPGAWYKSTNSGQFLRPETTYDSYDAYGDLLSYTDKDGVKSSIIWNRMIQKPVVIVRNMCYDTLLSVIGQDGIDVFAVRYTTLNSLRDESLTKLREYGKSVNVFLYDYSSTGNLLKKVGPNGLGFKYIYDSADRLSAVKTLNDILLETYKYNYREDAYEGLSPYYYSITE